jgi:broad specificity phosphatase PhoE
VILLARHGETADNVPPETVMGSRDVPLSERGRSQAEELAHAVAGEGVAAIWTSPLVRARETAEIVAATLGLAVRVDERLAESFRGSWEGRRLVDIEREEPEAWAAWLRGGPEFRFPGGGESLGEHQARALAALADVRGGPLPALVVCHGGTIRAIAAASHPHGLAGYHELSVPNAALLKLDDFGRWTRAA